jgi:RimJ/RimL family protein N-acetyltransferase
MLSLEIKPAQAIGIAIGCLVFSLTIATVIILLIKSGTINKFVAEMRGSMNPGMGDNKLKTKYQLAHVPQAELYTYLLKARETLSIKLKIPITWGDKVGVRSLQNHDVEALGRASDGSALFDGGSYDPDIVWFWLDLNNRNNSSNESSSIPINNPTIAMTELYHSLLVQERERDANFTNLVVIDRILNTPIGMLQLTCNSPENLSISLENLWLTPSCQGKRLMHEAILLVIEWLFSKGYRRIQASTDTRNVVGRKFFERCGFALEAILRKHKIVRKSNRDTALYRLLNSDWLEASVKLQRYCGKKKISTPLSPEEYALNTKEEEEKEEKGPLNIEGVVVGT